MSERIRGSVDIPLNDAGREAAKDVGRWFKKVGPPTRIIPSNLGRCVETADIIAKATNAIVDTPTAKLQPWHLGKYEGQESNKVHGELVKYIEDPNVKVPGRHAKGTADGESFGAFKRRVLPYIMSVIDQYKPKERILLVTHYRDIHLVRSWSAAGCPDDLEIDTNLMLKKYGDPACVYHLIGNRKQCKIVDVDTDSDTKLPFGIYLMRHGDTDWNN